MKRFVIALLLLTLLSSSMMAQYQVNDNMQNAWRLLMDLRIDSAKQLLQNELDKNPENYYAYYLDQTCDAYGLLINSSEDEYELFLKNYDKKRAVMDGKYESSPYCLFCKSEMDLQVAVFQIIHGSNFGGVQKAYAAYREVYKNLDKHPGFKPSLKLDGFFNVAMSNLPPFVKWVVSFFNVSSDFDYGVKTLTTLYQDQKDVKGINAEAALFFIFTAKINKTPEMVYDFTRNLDSNIRTLFIHQYFRANIAYRVGKNEQALHTMKQFNGKGRPYAELIYNYMMGKILLRKLDDSAGYYIEQYLKNLRKQEYFKEMTYNLALTELLKGNRARYNELCAVVRDEGSEVNERDREALYDASLDYQPDVNLVKARLLLEGSYLEAFKRTMDTYRQHPAGDLPYRLEYHFLTGRYQTETHQIEKAVVNFQWVIDHGSDEDYYFACASALALGGIYEAANNFEKARDYYKLASDLYDSDYYEYLGAKAEKSLERIKRMIKE